MPAAPQKAPANDFSSYANDFLDKVQDYIRDFFYIVDEKGNVGDARFDALTLTILCAAVILALGSACWAASIASARRHNPILHFALGLIIPWLYPLIILFAMDIPGKWDFVSQKDEKPAENAPAEEETAQEETAEAQPLEDIPFEPTQAYFSKIWRNAEGQPAGPWNCVFNGNPIVVTEILDILPECLIVMFYDKKPGDLHKMRFPYSKIDNWGPHQEA